MKSFFLGMMLFAFAMTNAQTKMYINKNSGGTDSVALSDIKNITFKWITPNSNSPLIIYGTKQSGSWEIWKMDGDGSNKTKIINTSSDGIYFVGLSLSPDRTKIVYSAGNSNAYQLYTINIDGTNKTKITSTTTSYLYYYSPKWLDNNTLLSSIARNGDEGKRDIIKINSDGTNIQWLTQSSTRSIGDPSLSPDRTKIAFNEGTPYAGAATELYYADYPSFANKKLIFDPVNPGAEGLLNWGDNNILYFHASGTNPSTKIYNINIDGTSFSSLTPAGSTLEYYPILSQDRAKIIFFKNLNNVMNIEIMDLTGNNRVTLTSNTTQFEMNGLDWK